MGLIRTGGESVEGTVSRCTADFSSLRRYRNNQGTHGSTTSNITGSRLDVSTLSDSVCQAHTGEYPMDAVTGACAVRLKVELSKQPERQLLQPASIYVEIYC